MVLTEDHSLHEYEIEDAERLNVFDIAQDNNIVDSKWNVPEMQPIVLVQRICWRKGVYSD